MPLKTAIIFIDGNNFYHNLKKCGVIPSQLDFGKLIDAVCEKFNVSCKKSIYYNSIPSIEHGEEIYYNHMKFLSSISKLPNFEVKTRKLQKISNYEVLREQKSLINKMKLCENCRPKVENHITTFIKSLSFKEKGIDVMIAVDMLNNALKSECDICILISGDADFIPVMELIKSSGKMVYSAFVSCGYSSEIRHTQRFMYIKNEMLLNCLKT